MHAHTHAIAPPGPTATRAGRRIAAGLLVAQFVGMWSAFAVLGLSIDWPASLELPASEMLPLLDTRFGAVSTGYTLYLAHALLMIPLGIALATALGAGPLLGGTTAALGVAAGLAKALGIVRWLFLMPGLAGLWLAPETSDATRDTITIVFEAFDAYAGGVGEILGVGLFTGVFTILVATALLRIGAPRLGASGFAAAALLLATLPSAYGIEMPTILLVVSGIAWQVWALVLAVALWRGRVG